VLVSTTLHARGLSAGHGERTLFADLDLTLAPGNLIALAGVNDAGKTTMQPMLCARLRPPNSITTSTRDQTGG
jgi:ABC-type multidrug transport system ATPase subunit